MSIENSLALALACFIVMVTPGPGVIALMGHALSKGLRRSVGFIIGMVCGDLVFLTLVIGGLAMIARTFETPFLVIRFAAAAYLIYLGVKAWRAGAIDLEAAAAQNHSAARGFFSGLLLTLSNPKVIVFYVGFLPGFFDLAALGPLDALIAVAIVLGVLVSVLVAYAVAAARARTLLNSERSRKLINWGSGSVMIGVGLTIAVR